MSEQGPGQCGQNGEAELGRLTASAIKFTKLCFGMPAVAQRPIQIFRCAVSLPSMDPRGIPGIRVHVGSEE